MTHARTANRGMPSAAIILAAAIGMAAVSTGALVVSGVLPDVIGPRPAPVVQPAGGLELHWRAAEDWELQRRQMSPFVDPVARSAEQWQLQRLQQSPYIDYAARSAAAWEEQRRQQSVGR